MTYYQSIQPVCPDMPECRLRNAEKEFLQQIMDRAVFNVQMRDMKKCCAYACRAVLADQKMLKLATAALRPLVLERLKCAGAIYFKGLFKRHARFLALPKPLRGKALQLTASKLGLVTHVNTVKVNVACPSRCGSWWLAWRTFW
jgi:hypothetical protein